MKFIVALLLVPTSLAFWRLPCSTLGVFRIDPIVSPGQASQHAHTLHGSQRVGFQNSYEELISSNCTSCAVKQDMSVYWAPPLMFAHPNGTIEMVPQLGGMTIYYFLFAQNILPFPEGFRMIAGDTNRRNLTIRVPDLPLSEWGSKERIQVSLAQKAIGYNCLNYSSTGEGALKRHYLPKRSTISRCIDGIRLEIMFPSCWDGVHLDSHDHKAHLAYPDKVQEGDCPEGFRSRIPALYYETVWNTSSFDGVEGKFLLSNGDYSGTSYHGDFLNGWVTDTLEEAIHECRNQSGLVEDCATFDLQSALDRAQCSFQPPVQLLGENCKGPRQGMCGNISI